MTFDFVCSSNFCLSRGIMHRIPTSRRPTEGWAYYGGPMQLCRLHITVNCAEQKALLTRAGAARVPSPGSCLESSSLLQTQHEP